jgi:predicted PurR-regulated permease PerM
MPYGYRSNPERVKRSKNFYIFFGLLITAMVLWIFIELQDMILPGLVGLLAAYVCVPALFWMQRKGVPKGVSVLLLFAGISLVVFIVGRQVVRMIPNEKQMVELKVKLRFKVNETYLKVIGKTAFTAEEKGNFVYSVAGKDLDPLIASLNTQLMLNNADLNLFFEYMREKEELERKTPVALTFWKQMRTLPFERPDNLVSATEEDETATGAAPAESPINKLGAALASWVIFPFVFIFLLTDEGDVKHYFINMVPNRYFEMTLTTLANVDRAIGMYLRGTLIECALVGLTFFIGMIVIGFDWPSSLLIGAIAGLSNAIPFLGPVIGLAFGVLYALISEDIDPLVSFLSADDALLGVAFVVWITQLVDNWVYQPIILGKAVNLHPLVVVLGVTGGSAIFGFAGMLFSIPAIVIVNVVLTTVVEQMKAYFIIY